MDLKVSNCLLGNKFRLKIGDFDQAMHVNEGKCYSRGTNSFRAPELKDDHKGVFDPKASDIYSAGIILFNLFFGFMPYIEGKDVAYINLELLLHESPNGFWDVHKKIHTIVEEVDSEFKKLFESMVCKDPHKRASIK